jgi:IclR family pca regulon transcriptional regulator
VRRDRKPHGAGSRRRRLRLAFPEPSRRQRQSCVGSRLPAYCTAPGRVILAYMEEGEAEAILESSPREKKTPHTVTGKAALLKILKEVRKQGFCINNQEAFIGDLSIASPVIGHAGRVVGAVNIAVPIPRWTVAQARRDLVPIVMRAARQITETLATVSV